MAKDIRPNLLPVAIMAHNEARFIERAVISALSQEVPRECYVKVVVVANGCTDNTEEIVQRLEKRNPGKVRLLAIRDKGKTKAIKRAISPRSHSAGLASGGYETRRHSCFCWYCPLVLQGPKETINF